MVFSCTPLIYFLFFTPQLYLHLDKYEKQEQKILNSLLLTFSINFPENIKIIPGDSWRILVGYLEYLEHPGVV